YVFLRDILISTVFFVGGLFVPKIISSIKKKKEREKFEGQLADSLFVISSSVKAGSNLLAALENAAAESKPPFSTGLSGVLLKTRVGVPLSDALSEFDGLSGINELHLAVVAIKTALEYGGNLSENLYRLAVTIKERKKLKDKMSAATAQGRLSAFTITAMPFLLAIILGFMEPDVFGTLTSTLYGKLLLLLAIFMSGLGNYFIMKIIKIR
ncbi:MAG: type II secretion system F family protein, partial [Elusimicrobiota bacterium]